MYAPAAPDDPASIYIHIPFCAHVCPYCDFTTYAGKESLIPRYVAALQRDLQNQAATLMDRTVHTVFLGGGTPSLLRSEQILQVIQTIRDHYELSPDAEISMEANPNGLTTDLLSGYRLAGVNRLSIGAQTFDRRGLRTLGRQHEANDVANAVAMATTSGFTNLSLDLIFGWPGQTLATWQQDLNNLLSFPADPLHHVSLYSLIIEPGTPFADAQTRGILTMPDDDAAADMYEMAMETLQQAGWVHYEVANWARSPDLASRHNMQYWRSGDFLGIGAGAHGTVSGVRTMNHLLPERYIQAIEDDAAAWSNRELIEPRIAEGETMMLGLRLLNLGVDRTAFANRHGRSLDTAFGSTISRLSRQGLIEDSGAAIQLTHKGLMLANDVVSQFLE